MVKMLKKYLSLLFLLIGTLVYSANDYIKPNILHQIIEEVYEGQPLVIQAIVMDNVAVRDVLVYYRVKGEKVFKYEPMSLEFNGYQFEIPSEDVGPYGVEYYLLATDDANNIASVPDFNPENNANFIEYIRFSETSAPDVLLMQPDDGGVYEDGNQMVVISIYDEEDDVDISTISLVIDGEDFTSEASVDQDFISFVPPGSFEFGTHTIQFSVMDKLGNAAPPSEWTFSIKQEEVKKTFLSDAKIKGTVDYESEYDMFSGKDQPDNRPLDNQKPKFKLTFSKGLLKASFSMALSEHFDPLAREIDSRRQPLDRFKFSIETPYASLKGGDHNPSFSELTLKGARIRGLIADANYKGIKTTLVYGNTKEMLPAILQNNDEGIPEYVKGTFAQKLVGVNTSYSWEGEPKLFIPIPLGFELGMNYLQVEDDTSSMEDELYGSFMNIPTDSTEKTKYSHQNNSVIGMNSSLSLFNNTRVVAYWAASTITDHNFDPTIDDVTLTATDAYMLEFSTQLALFDVKGAFKSIPRNFSSLGNSSVQTDIQGLKLDGRTKFLDSQIMLTMGFENNRNNLDLFDVQTTHSTTYATNANFSFKGYPGISVGYRLMTRNGEAVNQNAEGVQLSDDHTTTFTLGPSYAFSFKEIEFGLSGNVMLMDFKDNTNPEGAFKSNSYMLAVTQTFPSRLSLNLGMGLSQNIPVTETITTFSLINTKVSYIFANNLLKIYAGLGLVEGDKPASTEAQCPGIPDISNRKITFNVGTQYKISQNQMVGFDVGTITVNDFVAYPRTDYTEFRVKLKYKYSF